MDRSKTTSFALSIAAWIVAAVSPAYAAPAAAADSAIALHIDATADRHPISHDIYGMNNYGVDVDFAKALGVPVQRWGGNATTRYNWLADSSNSGADWYFMGGSGTTNPTPGAGADAFIAHNQAAGSKSLLTVPIMGWVNRSAEWNCSYPKSLYPDQAAFNPYVHPKGDDCGNGLLPDGRTQIKDQDPARNNLPVDANWMKAWIEHLVGKWGRAADGGVQIYEMDNEPFGWSNTHRDVHPQPTGWDELLSDTIAYAKMIKSVDPSAQIDGPGLWGPPAYFAGDDDWNRPLEKGMPFVAWYLQQLHDYQVKTGVRLLDYFDLHDYPWGVEANSQGAGDAAMQAKRLRFTRVLWDPTYTTEDWMGQWFTPAKQLALIPRMRKWVDTYYPGTKLAITEYNWGGIDTLNGALAEADILGIFGREGLDLATMWGPPKANQPVAYAFRMYLDYDGGHDHYGDVWVKSESADQGRLALYGAERSEDGALTLMVINKTDRDISAHLTLSHFEPAAAAQVYRYSGADLHAIVRAEDLPVDADGFSAIYPAASITLVVVPKSAG